ncbi:hypothetical protein V5O48_012830 [Marasmius crinis-equi]|uniref:F-box domain-containing protein n=1 Tax=Marasmius crinis-equi TaxID=585013 RepID=A0ABR3F1R3_9AGAR
MSQPLLCAKCKQDTDFSLTNRPLRNIETHVLRTNYVPSDVEVIQIRCVLEEEQRDLELCQAEITRLQQMIYRLEAEKQALEEKIVQWRSPISTLRKCPSEIWEIIFEMFCKSKGYSLDIDHDSHRKPRVAMLPITLSHVCSFWRDIVTAFPRAWASINVRIWNLSQKDVDAIGIFLEKSQNSLLTIRVERFDEDPPPSNSDQAVWKLLGNHSSRVQHLILGGDHHDTFQSSFGSDVTFPMLETYTGAPFNFDDLHWWQAIHAAPLLKTVTASTLHPRSTLPYHQLTTLILEDMNPGELLGLAHILPDCVELQHLSIECVCPETESLNFTPFQACSVRTLLISESYKLDIDSSMLLDFLDALTMPSLETFRLDCTDLSTDSGWPASLLRMLDRCAGSLRTLSIWLSREGISMVNSDRHLRGLLERVSNLTTFEFGMGWHGTGSASRSRRQPGEDFEFNNFVVAELFVELGNPDHLQVLAPNLSTISIHLSDITFDYPRPDFLGAILQAATSRSPGLATIRLVRMPGHILRWPISGSSPSCRVLLPGDVQERIEELRKDGVKVSIEERY